MAPRGILLDLQGVLHQDGAAIPGAAAAMHALAAHGLELRFLTNTTTRPRGAIAGRLADMGFGIGEAQIFTPARAAARLMAAAGIRRVHLAAEPELGEDLAGFDLVEEGAEAVVLGDLHLGFTWQRLNALYRLLDAGARLIALHKNRYCRRDGALALDLGPFVAALEYAAATEAEVVGKPSVPFFAAAVADMGLGPDEVLMVGDDIEADVEGAVAAGLGAIQVRTGKYTIRDEARASDALARLDSVADLPAWLDAGA